MSKKIDPANVTQLIALLGGKENIATLTHCITRLRFVLAADDNIQGTIRCPLLFTTGKILNIFCKMKFCDHRSCSLWSNFLRKITVKIFCFA